MSSCKECFHYEMCFLESVRMGKYQDVETRCDQFKNKADVVSKKAYEQVKWERDTAIEQLNSYGVDFCEKADVVPVVRCKDCEHSRQLEKNVELNRAHYLHCAIYRGEEEKVWVKYKRYYKEYSIVEPDDYCSYGERKEQEK